MKGLIKTTKTYLSFHKRTDITNLITFSHFYEEMLPVLKKYTKENKGKSITLEFTRINEDGTLQEPRNYTGVVSKLEENYFIFTTNHHISIFTESDDLVDNIIRTDSVLGIIPIMPNFETKKILTRNKNEISKEYFSFLAQVRRALKDTLGVEHSVELCFNNFTIECEILEVNKSNIKIYQKRRHSTKRDKDGKYIFVDIVPQKKFILFLEKEDALLSVNIDFKTNLKINPHDED